MSLNIEIKGEDKEKIAKEIEEELRKKYGEKVGRIIYYSPGSYNIAKLGLSIVQTILIFLGKKTLNILYLKGLKQDWKNT